MPVNRDPSRRPSPLHRPASPPPPPRPPILEESKPNQTSSFEPPHGSPTLRQEEKRGAREPLGFGSRRQSTQITIIVLVVLGATGALWGLRLERNEADQSSRSPVTPATSTIAKTVEPSTEVRTNSSSVPVQQLPGQDPDWELLARSVVDVWSPGCEWGGSGTIVLDGSYVLTKDRKSVV